MSETTDAKAELHREICAFGLDPLAGLCALRLSVGRAGHAAGGRDRPRGLAMRGAPAAGAGARRSRRGGAARRRLRPWHRQVGAGRVDHPVGALDPARHPWRGQRQHRSAAAHQDMARARQVAQPCHQPRLVRLHRDRAAFGAARQGPHVARRLHHLVGEQHRGHCRPAQQGPPRLRPARRGVGHPRRGVGDHRGRPDRRRHRALLGGVRQSDAQHWPLPRVLRRRPLCPSLARSA
jgi:hypothetical protein